MMKRETDAQMKEESTNDAQSAKVEASVIIGFGPPLQWRLDTQACSGPIIPPSAERSLVVLTKLLHDYVIKLRILDTTARRPDCLLSILPAV